jgi:MinD-like ATPase involved in chromosome partitioning or flagellar assembly
MLTLCWAAKGGSGTTVVVAALGLSVEPPVLLVDLDGDLPSVYGLAEPSLPGVHDWVVSDAAPDRLIDLAIPVVSGVSVVCAGLARAPAGAERWRELGLALAAHPATVVVDAGTGSPPAQLVGAADRSLLVTRACYLALRRAVALDAHPTGVVLIEEAGRALRSRDVETAIDAPVVATLALDPAVARAVDAGLLAARLPRLIQRELRNAA